MDNYLNQFSRGVSRGTAIIATLCAFAMILSLLNGVFYRYVLNDAPSWTDEVAVLAFSWSVMLFASVLVQENGHVRITLLLSALPAFLEKVLEKLSILLVLAFGALMLWAGWQFTLFTADQVSPTLRYPLWIRSAAIPISGFLIVLHSLVLLVNPSRSQAVKEVTP